MENHSGNPGLSNDFEHLRASCGHYHLLLSYPSGYSHPSSSTKRGTVSAAQPSSSYHVTVPPTLPDGEMIIDGNLVLNSISASIRPASVDPQAAPDERVGLQDEVETQEGATLRKLIARRLAVHDAQGEATDARASVTVEGIRKSIELHRSLASEELAMPLTPQYIDEEGVEMAIIEIKPTGDGSNMAIPFFPGLLRKTAAEPCCVCSANEEFSPDLVRWCRAARGFGSHWIKEFLTFPFSGELPECCHAMDICRACLRKYIQDQVHTRGRGVVDNLTCPSFGCPHKLTVDEIRSMASPETFVAYDSLLTAKKMGECPHFRWCLNPDCGEGGFHENLYMPMCAASHMPDYPCCFGCITCPHCEFAMCYFCQVPWHDGLTCEAYQERGAGESKPSQDWIKRHTKRCPGDGCGAPIQFEGGCYQMSCTQCEVRFCWGCKGTGKHHDRCRYGAMVEENKRNQEGVNNVDNVDPQASLLPP